MKNLIFNSVKIVRALHPIVGMNSSNRLIGFGFGTIKSQTVKQPKTRTKRAEKFVISEPEKSPLFQRSEQSLMAMSREQAEKEAVKIMKNYITIDEIKSKPGAIRSLLLTFVKVLEYQKQTKGRQFYIDHKQQLYKISYDLRCYNAQSSMKNDQILLTYYFSKLLKDCGYSHAPSGFQLRSSIKLASHIKVKQSQNISDALSMNQVIYGRWLMSVLGISNHEYKWKSHMMMVDIFSRWKKMLNENYVNKTGKQTEFALKFCHFSVLLSSFYNQSIHLTSDYQSVQHMIKMLYFHTHKYASYQQLMQNQDMFLETFSCIIGLEQHWFSGQTYYETRQVVNHMSNSILKRLMSRLVSDSAVGESFAESKSLSQFQKSQTFQTYKNLTKQKKPLYNFTQQDLYRYFIFFNEIHQNEVLFQNLSADELQKMVFILNEIFHRYYHVIIHDKKYQMNEQTLSIYARIWLIKRQLQLKKLEKDIRQTYKEEMRSIEITLHMEKIAKDFSQVIQFLSQRIQLKMDEIPGQKNKNTKKTKPYLTAKEKQTEEQKNAHLKSIERNIVKPLIDFIFSIKKYHIDTQQQQQQQIESSKIISMIDSLQKFLTILYGDIIETKQTNNQTRSFSIENKFFWTLKFMRLQSMHVTDNKIYLKEFQSFLLENIVKNNLKQKPQNFYCVSVYNLYAYMCLVQGRMMLNEEKHHGTHVMKDSEIRMESFVDKKEYKYFLAYKNYLSTLIFTKSNEMSQSQSKQTQGMQIPKKLRIDSLFKRTQHTRQENEKHQNQQQKNTQTTENIFSIQTLFTIVFRQNRFYNHKILSQQVLLNLFGNQKLLNDNTFEYIQKKNQRSGQNYYELIYMILLAGDSNHSISSTPNAMELNTIKNKVFQALVEKAKGSLALNIIREIAGLRKTSYMKPAPLKYRLRPYSIFETVQKQPIQRKKQILNNLMRIYYPSSSFTFGFTEILFQNLTLWTGSQRSQIVGGIIIPWLAKRIQKGEIAEGSALNYMKLVIRLLRRSNIQITPQNEHAFLQVISNQLPEMFKKFSRANRQLWRYTDAIGYLLDMEQFLVRNLLNSKNVAPILQQCQQNIFKNEKSNIEGKNQENKLFNLMYETLERVLAKCKYDKTVFQSRQHARNPSESSQSNLFRKSERKQTYKDKQSVKKGMFSKK